VKAGTARIVAIVALGAMLAVAACAAPVGAPTASTSAPTATTPATPSPEPTTAPSPTAAPATTYTEDDRQIAELVRSISADAKVSLAALKGMSLDKQLPALQPVPKWVNERKAEVDAFTPSGCTEAAVLLFFRGLDKYSDIAEKFLAWREWGVVGAPYPRNMPMQATAFLDDAVEGLVATCPG